RRRPTPWFSTCPWRSHSRSRPSRSLCPCSSRLLPSDARRPMKPRSVAVVGAAETTDLGVIPGMSQIQLHADAALNTLKDAGLRPSDIDGIATAGETPTTVAHYLRITPTWVDR